MTGGCRRLEVRKEVAQRMKSYGQRGFYKKAEVKRDFAIHPPNLQARIKL
jgi:hypothetical protein